MFRYTDLFFMGAAFLLLETKSVVQFALLFGTTWFVNALVFLGVLLSVLLAVAVSKRVTFKHPARLYVLLLLGLAARLAHPGRQPALAGRRSPGSSPRPPLAFFPIFVANLIFTQRFKDVAASATAFGANLLGAMVGGILEYTALITGYRGAAASSWPCCTGSRCSSVAGTSARGRTTASRSVTATCGRARRRRVGPVGPPRTRVVSRLKNLSSRQKTALVLIGLGLLFLLPLRGLLRAQGPPMEEGFMLVFPERVLHGDIPNKDFLHLYGPGSLWVLAAIYKVFGTQLVDERLFGLAAADRHRARHVRAGPLLGPDRRALLRRDRARHHPAADRARPHSPGPAASGSGSSACSRRSPGDERSRPDTSDAARLGARRRASSPAPRCSSGSTSSSRSASPTLAALWGTDMALQAALRRRGSRVGVVGLPRAPRHGRARQRLRRHGHRPGLQPPRRAQAPGAAAVGPPRRLPPEVRRRSCRTTGRSRRSPPRPSCSSGSSCCSPRSRSCSSSGSGPSARTAARFQARVLLAVALFSLGMVPQGDAAGRLGALRVGELRAVRVRARRGARASGARARRSRSLPAPGDPQRRRRAPR